MLIDPLPASNRLPEAARASSAERPQNYILCIANEAREWSSPPNPVEQQRVVETNINTDTASTIVATDTATPSFCHRADSSFWTTFRLFHNRAQTTTTTTIMTSRNTRIIVIMMTRLIGRPFELEGDLRASRREVEPTPLHP